MTFPPFSDYQETFLSPLLPATFATYVVPEWVPTPANLVRIARAIYPHWRERRIERGGHRIIPALNVNIFFIAVTLILTKMARWKERGREAGILSEGRRTLVREVLYA